MTRWAPARRARHFGRLVRELAHLAWAHKAWWIVPVTLVLLGLAVLVVVGAAVSPALYTVF